MTDIVTGDVHFETLVSKIYEAKKAKKNRKMQNIMEKVANWPKHVKVKPMETDKIWEIMASCYSVKLEESQKGQEGKEKEFVDMIY